MANYCENCGAKLNGTSTFCTQCGSRVKTPVAQQQKAAQPARPIQQQPYRQPRQSQPKPQQQQYRQPQLQNRQQQIYQQRRQPIPTAQPQQPKQPKQAAQPKSVKSKQAKQHVKAQKQKNSGRKKSRFGVIIGIAAAVVLIGAFLLTAFVAPGFLKPKKAEPSLTPSSENALAMLEYARQLEENGNYDAAAQIYSMLPNAVLDGAAEESKKLADESPEKKIIDGAGDVRDILNDIDDLMED